MQPAPNLEKTRTTPKRKYKQPFPPPSPPPPLCARLGGGGSAAAAASSAPLAVGGATRARRRATTRATRSARVASALTRGCRSSRPAHSTRSSTRRGCDAEPTAAAVVARRRRRWCAASAKRLRERERSAYCAGSRLRSAPPRRRLRARPPRPRAIATDRFRVRRAASAAVGGVTRRSPKGRNVCGGSAGARAGRRQRCTRGGGRRPRRSRGGRQRSHSAPAWERPIGSGTEPRSEQPR